MKIDSASITVTYSSRLNADPWYLSVFTSKLSLLAWTCQSTILVPMYLNITSHSLQEAQLSLRDHAMRRVNWNLANFHATVQCRNYLYDKSWPNRWYEVGDLVGGNAWYTMCTQPWRDRVGCHCLKCHKQTDDVELCISPVYRRLAVAKFSKSTM